MSNLVRRMKLQVLACGFACVVGFPFLSFADETCQSPYMPKMTGHEDYVYI